MKGPSRYVLGFKPTAVSSSLKILYGSDVFLVLNPDPTSTLQEERGV